MKFIDEVTIEVASGKGGPGAVSFRREAMTPRGGPDGGDGGKGGSVIFRADTRLGSLLDLRLKKKYKAEDGEKGGGQNQFGADGQDLVIHVPAGTVIKNQEGQILADIGPEQEFVFLKGGRGGKGNHFFKSSVNQAPTHAQPGEAGQSATVQLELKLLADVGIIGFPNAGKSTLISRISAARPKIADYPFTTLIPNLGVVSMGDFRSFVVADIPGLIEGAHTGAGLGTQFLRHIERTRLFIHLIDASDMAPRDGWESYLSINKELAEHDSQNQDKDGYDPLAKRRQLVVLNKVDAASPDNLERLIHQFKSNGIEVFQISAVTGQNIKELVYKVGSMLFEKSEF